jgi:photosystem II stability/assembly factor-like uncharacterized protein
MEWDPAGKLPKLSIGSWVIAITNDGHIWAHSNHLELYLSTDNGDTWVKKGNIPIWSNSISVSPVNGNIFASSISNGLYRSINNGETWKNVLKGIAVRGIFFTESGEIYIGGLKMNNDFSLKFDSTGKFIGGIKQSGENVCYYSSDNGNTWIEKSIGLPTNFAPLALGKDGTLYAKSTKGVYRSTDGGATWLPPENDINTDSMDVNCLTICDDGPMFTTTYYNIRILKSTDKGANWSRINTDFVGAVNRIIYNNVTKDIFITTILYNPGVDDHLIYRSANLGKDWKLENIGFPINKGLYDLTFNPTTGQMFIGTRTGVYRTKNYPY